MFKFSTAVETLLSKGPATFSVSKVYEYGRDGHPLQTRAGHSYLKIELVATDCNGNNGVIYENLISNIGWKIKQFAESINCPDLFKQGSFNPQVLVGRRGTCELDIKPAENGYPEKTYIKKFAKNDSMERYGQVPEPAYEPKTIEEAFDDIPF